MQLKVCKTTFKRKDYNKTFEIIYKERGIKPILSYLWMTIVTLLILSSCGTPKIVKEHIETDNILGLIDDYASQSPKNKKIIEKHIFAHHDYSKNTYGELKNFHNKSQSENLMWKFSGIIKNREDSILSILDGFDKIKDISSYYKKHEDEQSFLTPIIAGTLLQNIQEYEYKDVRTIYREFKNTEIKDSIYPIYVEKRSHALPAAMNSVDKYCKSEIKLIDVYKAEGKKRIPQVASTAFEQMIDQLLDCDLSQNQSQLKVQYNNITSKYNPISPIKNVVKDEVQKMMKDINECRAEIIKELLDSRNTNKYKLPSIPIIVKKKSVYYPTKDFKAIASIYNKPTPQNKLSTALSIASWLPGFIGAAASAADIYKTYKDTQKKAAEVTPYIKHMATAVFKNFAATCNQEYDESFKNVRKSILKNQEQLKQSIYEDF